MCCGSSVSVRIRRTAACAGGDATPASDRRYLLLHTLAAHGNYRCLLSSGLGSPSGGMSIYCSKAWAPLTARQLEDELALLSQLAQSAAAVPAHALASVMVRALLCLSRVECVGHRLYFVRYLVGAPRRLQCQLRQRRFVHSGVSRLSLMGGRWAGSGDPESEVGILQARCARFSFSPARSALADP